MNELILLYSQAVEYYNGINDDKHIIYSERIQNVLVRPEVQQTMQAASRDPSTLKKEEQERKTRLDSMAPDELEKLRQEEFTQRKKERAAKMKINNEMQETIKRETDQNYKAASEMYETQEKKAVIAKNEVDRDLSK